MGGTRGERRPARRYALRITVVVASLAALAPPTHAAVLHDRPGAPDQDATVIAELARRQLEELDIPDRFMPFLRADARVRTGRQVFADPAPDLTGGPGPEILETDLRYSYSVQDGQQLPSVTSEVDTRIAVRSGATGRKLWDKRFDRDAWPLAMRLGSTGRPGVLVISGLWNFYGTTEESTLTFDAFDGRRGKHLWTREYRSITSYDLLTTITEDAPLFVARFDGLQGPAGDIMLALATQVSTPLAATMATRVVVIDGATGEEHAHPTIDIGIDWWPIPIPTKDLDGDGLDDYATTNNHGLDPGGAQEPPTFGGTVYARKGTDGSSIWTTSGVEMALFAFTTELPDVVADETPDLALSTYVERKESPLPVAVPYVTWLNYRERVYLFEGSVGGEAWHKRWEWVYSPGDINGGGKADLMLGKFRARFRKGTTTLYQLAVVGTGSRLWKRRSVWNFETMPCPRGLCMAEYWFLLDVNPDVQADGVDDVLFSQYVRQNEAFEDSVTRVFNGRTGKLRFQDEDGMQSARVAIDGHGTDFISFDHTDDRVRVTAVDGWNRMLWTGILGGPDKLLPRNSGFWAGGFVLPGDRCGDVVINGWEREDSFYGVFDGDTGRLMWSRWTGPGEDRPRFTRRRDHNESC